ncbi:hypothetical protein DMB66_38645 [Actinoplanes sp. ATCC 53533]|uniref:hypothetical protein n=1 Tax=Actinoplanes sp. ATCC 53533 TaxID=1288362 RepID=UPI000F784DCE|nr:hypothetical protein [Actinoplanes sp. ATCC 53533]RSM53724.1 hypothetical protein DMB66_38645 [Actinoplanes sp. ATCC 53533]
MRHIYTLIAAMYVVPASWLLLAFGQDRSAQVFADARTSGAFDTGAFVAPAMCLAGAGLLLGLFATLRFSPLGVVLTGSVLAAGHLALLVDPDGVLGLFPRDLSVAGRAIDSTTPLRTGSALLLGALMVAASLCAGRWPARTRDKSPGPGRPAPVTGPDMVNRYAGTRRPGNKGPHPYASGTNSIDRWPGPGRSPWPYAQRSQDRSLGG